MPSRNRRLYGEGGSRIAAWYASSRRGAFSTSERNWSASRRMRRNCHHFSTMRYHDTTEKTARIASTNCVSRLDVSTSSHGVVGTARPTCSSTLASTTSAPVPPRVGPVPTPRACEDLLQARPAGAPAEHGGGPLRRRDELGWIAGPARPIGRRDRVPGNAARRRHDQI